MKGDRIRDAVREPEVEDITAHLDWSKAVRGRHYIPRQKITVNIDEDMALYFNDDESVNAALRIIVDKALFPL